MVSVAVLGILLLSGSRAWAMSPSDTLREFFQQAVAVIDDPRAETHPQEALSKIRKIANTVFDVREAAQMALGPHWAIRSAAEREEFILLFGQLVELAYLNWVTSLISGKGIYIQYEGEATHGAHSVVQTTIQAKDGRNVPFDYRMVRSHGKWTIRDVVVDGVSLIDNYRAQFKRVLATSPYSTLIASMRAKTSADAFVRGGAGMPTATVLGREGRSQAP
jgi:phospholipid transport system substrate-binding protein